MNIVDKIRNEQLREGAGEFGIGDTVKIFVKIVEGDTERVQSFTGTVFFAPVLFFAPLPQTFAAGPTLAVVFLGFGVTFVAYGLYNYGVSRAPAAKAAAFINLIPVFACLLARIMLDETLTAAQWIGGLMALGGVALSARPGGKKKAGAP